MAQKTMYTTIVGEPVTTLTAPYQAGIDTTVHLADTSFLPDPGTTGNTCTIWLADRTYLVTVRYTAKLSASITGVTVVQGYPQAAVTATFPIGSTLGKPLSQDDVQSIQDNIRDLASVVPNYSDLTNKPSINSVELIGDKTSDDLGLLRTQYTSAQDGYIAKVDSADHKLKVMPASTASVTFADITGVPTDNTNLATALAGKVSIREGTDIELGTDANGVYVWT